MTRAEARLQGGKGQVGGPEVTSSFKSYENREDASGAGRWNSAEKTCFGRGLSLARAQGSEHRGKMWSPMTRRVSGGRQIKVRRSREGTRMSEVPHLKLEFANRG